MIYLYQLSQCYISCASENPWSCLLCFFSNPHISSFNSHYFHLIREDVLNLSQFLIESSGTGLRRDVIDVIIHFLVPVDK